MKITVLGCGLVGRPMAMDLARENEFKVTVADNLVENLAKMKGYENISTLTSDLSDPVNILQAVENSDIVLNALPGYMGYNTMSLLLEAGKNVVDISFFPEDPRPLAKTSLEKGVTAILDCGVAPGMSNIISGYCASRLDLVKNIIIYVGGLPKKRVWPWDYKAVFSPADVIEEYTRPARFIENGRLVIREALTDPEYLEFAGAGTLEAFNSDGLRSLMYTIACDDMKEKTLRYPGHIEKISVLKSSGFFSEKPLQTRGGEVIPLDFTSNILFANWKMQENDEDMTVMKIIVKGIRDNEAMTYTWELYDEYDHQSGIHSMARTTGYTATMAVRMLASGLYKNPGKVFPEHIGEKENCFDYLIKGLAERGIHYKHQIQKSAQ